MLPHELIDKILNFNGLRLIQTNDTKVWVIRFIDKNTVDTLFQNLSKKINRKVIALAWSYEFYNVKCIHELFILDENTDERTRTLLSLAYNYGDHSYQFSKMYMTNMSRIDKQIDSFYALRGGQYVLTYERTYGKNK